MNKFEPRLILLLLPLMLFWGTPSALGAPDNATIIDEWNKIVPPPAPQLQTVNVDSGTTAVLVLDIQTQTCSQRPRCAASIPVIQALLAQARDKDIPVIYSLTSAGTLSDIPASVAPLPQEPVVKSFGVDKFYNTDLEKILREKGIKTVIITGTAANGAVLHTAVAAALRNFQVVVPVDGMSASDPYAEQYTAWHMLNSPGTKNRVVLTKASMINLQ